MAPRNGHKVFGVGERPVVAGLVGPTVVTEEMDPRSVTGELLPPERPAVAGAVEKRVWQYTAGRICARRALARLGLPEETPIVMGGDRMPIWPEGFVGSISHTDHWCAAAVARESDVRSVGIDLEGAKPFKEELWQRVCTVDERLWLEGLEEGRELMSKVLFCAKEAVYKCQYTITKQYLGFHGVSVRLGKGRFQAAFRDSVGEFQAGDTLEGRYLVRDDIIATACVLAA